MPRMFFDVTPEIQMAIRLRAIKAGMTTGEVVTEAITIVFNEDILEAKEEKDK